MIGAFVVVVFFLLRWTRSKAFLVLALCTSYVASLLCVSICISSVSFSVFYFLCYVLFFVGLSVCSSVECAEFELCCLAMH